MRRHTGVCLLLATLALNACVLPDVDVDESLGPSQGSSSGAGGAGSGDDEDRETVCIRYCDLFFEACEESPANDYVDTVDCYSKCGASTWPLGAESEASGSVRCRLTHAGFAMSTPDVHCPHAARVPVPSCPPNLP